MVFRIGRRERDTEIDGFVFYPQDGLSEEELDFLLANLRIPEPCPGDFDLNASRDFVDMSTFLGLIDADDPASDLTGEGLRDLSDLILMFQLVGVACPSHQGR